MPWAIGSVEMIKVLASCLLVLAALGGCATARPAQSPGAAEVAAPRIVYVTRHLQKGEGDDPPLTAEGAANAERLAAMLADKGITAIFATPTRRTMETAAPLSTRLGIAVTPYDHRDPDALLAAVSEAPGPVLVVGHSNTVPDLVAIFGGARPEPISEEDFGTLFVVAPDGEVTTLAVR